MSLFRYCPQCKEHREATKQMSVWRLPVLIIHLKKFSFHNFIWRDKIDKLVKIPLRYVYYNIQHVICVCVLEIPLRYNMYTAIYNM